MNKFDYFWLILTVVTIIVVWTSEPPIDSQWMPTIVNGATSVTAIMVAFTGVLIAFMRSNEIADLIEAKDRIYYTLLFSSLAVIFLSTAYLSFVSLNPHNDALKFSITGMSMALGTFLTFVWFILDRISKSRK